MVLTYILSEPANATFLKLLCSNKLMEKSKYYIVHSLEPRAWSTLYLNILHPGLCTRLRFLFYLKPEKNAKKNNTLNIIFKMP